MKRVLRLISFITAIVLMMSVFPVSVNALKLSTMSYRMNGVTFSVDTEGGRSPVTSAYLDTTVKYSGDNSIKIVYESDDLNMEYRTILPMKGLEKGKTYRLRFMMKAENLTVLNATMEYHDQWYILSKVLNGTFDWVPVEFEFEWKSDTGNTNLVLVCAGKCDGLWFDDFRIQKKVDGKFVVEEKIFTNPGFEDTTASSMPIINYVSETDEVKEVTRRLESKDALILKKAENIIVDGEIDDWDSYEKYPIPTYFQLVQGSEQTIDAYLKYAYDEKNLYYLAVVEDEEHRFVRGSTYWSGDGIQSVVDNNNANGYGEPIGVYYDSEKDKVVFVSDNGGADIDTSGENSVKGAGKRDGTTTIYEVKIPWEYLGMKCPEKVKFSLIINDNDGGVRKGWMEVSKGIGDTKTNARYPYLFLGAGGAEIKASLVKSEVSMDENFVCNFEYLNIKESEQKIIIKVAGNEYSITVPPMSSYGNEYILPKADDVGEYKQVILVDDGTASEVNLSGYTLPDDAFAERFVEQIKLWVAELDGLRDQCEARGLPTPYENADIRFLETYIDNIPWEANYGSYYKIAHYYDILPGVYEECRESLNAILNGEKEAVDVPKYVTSELTIRDGAYWGTVEKDGIQYESPLVFTGFCAFMAPRDWMHDANEYGINHAEIGVYANTMIKWNGTEFDVIPEEDRFGMRSDEYEWGRVLEQLEYCDKYGISVSLGVTAGAWPNMEQYGISDYVTEGAANHNFNAFNVTHPMVQTVTDAVFKEVANLVEKYECIDSICVLNEPTVKLYNNSYYFDEWAQFLAKRYDGDINKLNMVYGGKSKYTDFSEVKMPAEVLYGLPLYHDYRMFCEDVYRQFLQIIRNSTNKYIPGIPIVSKEMQRTRAYNEDYTINMATTAEKNIDLYDLAGCDAFYVEGRAELGLDIKMMWYDYLTSVMEKPIQNGEDHIGSDGQGDETKFYDTNVYNASSWQGMIHGGGAQDLWYYGDHNRGLKQAIAVGKTDGSEFEPHVNLLKLPRSMRDSYRNTLDSMRLLNEINALYTAPRNVGILWSNTTWSYSPKFMNGLYRAYESAIYNGQRVKFITESTLNHLDKVNLLVVPGSINTTPEALDAIKRFIVRGGKVVMIGKDSLGKDDFNQPLDTQTVAYIRENSTIIESDVLASGATMNVPENFDEIMGEEYKKAGFMNVVLIDAETEKQVKDVEWISNEYNGKVLINPFNYNSNEAKKVEVWINGEKAERFTDLKGQKTYNGEIALDFQQPYLLEVDTDDSFTDISHVSWAKDAIYALRDKGVANGTGGRKFAPDASISREQLAKMLAISINAQTEGVNIDFVDVDSNQWYAPYISAAFDMGIAKGISETNFGVGEAVSRQDLAVMVYRAACKVGKLAENPQAVNIFDDAEKTASYATEAVAALKAAGIINGDEKNCFNPTDSCSRAEAAKIIYNTFYK